MCAIMVVRKVENHLISRKCPHEPAPRGGPGIRGHELGRGPPSKKLVMFMFLQGIQQQP